VTRGRPYVLYVLVVLAGISFLNALDQSVLSAVAANIQAEFSLSDAQIGTLVSAFVIALALAAMPLGYWADRGTRRTIMGLGVAVWSVATLATGLTHTFPQMLAARTVLGIGEASSQPATASLIGDYVSKRARGRALAAIITAGGLGLGGGLILGGTVGLHLGWRWAFYVAAAPGVLLALLALTMREPLRGAAETRGPKVAVARDSGLHSFARLLRIRSYAAVLVAAGCTFFGIAAFNLVPLYVHRRFGLNIAQAGTLVGIPTLIGVVIGTPLGGWLVDWRGRRSPRAAAEVGLVGLLATSMATLIQFAATSVAVFAAAAVAAVLFSSTAILASAVVFQNVIQPSLRASALSMNLTSGRLFGALGPLAVGLVSDLMGRNLGRSLLLIIPAIYLVGAGCYALALASMNGDVERMEETWAQREVPPVVA
jgi:MFS family permease